MWGNRIGWAISALLLFLICVGMWAIWELGQPSPPTDEFQKHRSAYLARLDPPFPWSQVMPMDDSGDATELYHKAIETYLKNEDAYRKYKSTDPDPEACTLILKAAHCKTGTVLTYDLPEMANYQLTLHREPLDAIDYLINDVVYKRAVALGTDKKFDEQRKYLEAIFAIGTKMFEERLNFDEFSKSMAFIGSAMEQLAKNAQAQGNQARADELAKLNTTRLSWRKEHLEYWIDNRLPHGFLPNIKDADLLATHAGSVYALAKYGKDRMVRVEALLTLGRIRFSIGDNGRAIDQKASAKLLGELAQSETDPAVKNAAEAARDLTVENWRIER